MLGPLPPKGFEGSWPFHVQLWPMQRARTSSSSSPLEQIIGVFLVDVLPEDAAATLRAIDPDSAASAPVIDAASVAAAHAQAFGIEPVGGVFAPGRVNLIGDHTDYNEGCFPVALEIGTYIAYSRNASGLVRARSLNLDDQLERPLTAPAFGDWLDYVIGALQALAGHSNSDLPAGLDLTIGSTVPTGASVSSSAALQVATIRAGQQAFGVEVSAVDIARLAQRAENHYVGVNCD